MHRSRFAMAEKKIGFFALAVGLMFLIPARSDGSLIAGSQLSITGNGVVGATFLNWNCDDPSGPVCPAGSGDFGVASSTIPVRLPSTTGTTVLSKT